MNAATQRGSRRGWAEQRDPGMRAPDPGDSRKACAGHHLLLPIPSPGSRHRRLRNSPPPLSSSGRPATLHQQMIARRVRPLLPRLRAGTLGGAIPLRLANRQPSRPSHLCSTRPPSAGIYRSRDLRSQRRAHLAARY